MADSANHKQKLSKPKVRVTKCNHKSECGCCKLDPEMRRRAESFQRQFPDAWRGFEEYVLAEIEKLREEE